jgi:hypothetical protein
MIEIRLNLKQPETALKGITAVVDELIANHDEKLAPRIQILQSTQMLFDKYALELRKSADTIAENISSNREIRQDNTSLLIARYFTDSGLIGAMKTASDIKYLLSNIRKTRAIMVPTVMVPSASAPYRFAATGTLAGLLVGLLVLQMFPSLFQTGRPRLGVSRSDPVS